MFEKAKLNYQAATTLTPPACTIPAPASHMEGLDRAIMEKVEQNARREIATYEATKDLIVR